MRRDGEERIRTDGGTTTVAEIAARCSVLEPGIVLMREVSHGNAETYEVLLESAEELGAEFDHWAMVVDLADVVARPKGHYLEEIRRRPIGLLGTDGQPVHLALTQPAKPFMRVVRRFVLGHQSTRVSVHASREEALAACRKAIAAAKGKASKLGEAPR